ncbi:hypothetical protein MNKW57_20240 [Biformimicrobium ophioploci]|uniref:RCK N-terminal domain-containing protein n=2 Tax=Biformimicrobium ophioploci TaxID=3036711 RepID=A0ABQ6M025_9GAMM|nr:hypothetical protein MNKW57_20240 [Microbulbifer sp. NKW57]
MRGLADLLRRNEWVLVSVLIVICFAIGCVGHAGLQLSDGAEGSVNYWDAVYSTFQLFIFEGPDVTDEWPLQMQLVRLLSPFLLIYAAVKTIWLHVGTHVSLFFLRFAPRRFVVICGIGETGERLAREYLQRSRKAVVLVDRKPENPRVEALCREGAIAVRGDALDCAVLNRARVYDAREIFLFTGDEQSNIAIAKIVHRLVRPKTGSRPHSGLNAVGRNIWKRFKKNDRGWLCCYMEVDSPDIYELFESHPFFGLITETFRVKIFNRDESVARNIFSECAPDLYYLPKSAEDRGMNVLFLGFSPLVRQMIIQLALTAHYPDLRIPKARVICCDAFREEIEKFQRRFPNLDDVIELSFTFRNPLTIKPQEWFDIQAHEQFAVCYCSLTHDVDSILAVRRINRIQVVNKIEKLNFVICLNQQTWIADVVDDVFVEVTRNKGDLSEAEPIEYFETLDRTITQDVIVNDSLDAVARVIHEEYLGADFPGSDAELKNASGTAWEDLPRHKRVANQRAADHLDVKLRIIGCARSAAVNDYGSFVMTDEEIDVLAKVEHQRWMADKYLSGYVCGELRDEVRMSHPDLKSWDMLSEADREKDRQNVRLIPHLLKMLGQVAERSGYVGEPSPNVELQVQGAH